uniref:Uncharacterized protein n=1 Tax=Romanomermis culicivorax TaxID=13658 RepID=A0A915KI04_ROMCU
MIICGWTPSSTKGLAFFKNSDAKSTTLVVPSPTLEIFCFFDIKMKIFDQKKIDSLQHPAIWRYRPTFWRLGIECPKTAHEHKKQKFTRKENILGYSKILHFRLDGSVAVGGGGGPRLSNSSSISRNCFIRTSKGIWARSWAAFISASKAASLTLSFCDCCCCSLALAADSCAAFLTEISASASFGLGAL